MACGNVTIFFDCIFTRSYLACDDHVCVASGDEGVCSPQSLCPAPIPWDDMGAMCPVLQTPTLLGQRHSQESALQSQVSGLYLCILSQQTRLALHSPLKAGLGSSVWTHLGSSIDTMSHRVWPGSRTRHSFLRDSKLGNS